SSFSRRSCCICGPIRPRWATTYERTSLRPPNALLPPGTARTADRAPQPKLDGQRARVHVRNGHTVAYWSRPGRDLLRHRIRRIRQSAYDGRPELALSPPSYARSFRRVERVTGGTPW